MYRGGSRLLPVLLVIIVIVVAIIALVSVGRALLNRGAPAKPVDNPAERTLLMTEADRSVRMAVRGPLIADEDFNTYQIEVSPTVRRMTTYKGYQDQVIDTKQFSNSMDAYVEFVHALARANFASRVQLSDELNDTRGACATGRLYKFDTLQAQSVTSDSWVSSCRNLPGSFKGNAAVVRDLFLKQIPDSDKMLQALKL